MQNAEKYDVSLCLQVGDEIAQAYCASLIGMVSSVFEGEPKKNEPDDAALQRLMSDWGFSGHIEFLDTLIYLRRRRNIVVHMVEKLPPEMKAFLSGGAKRLAAFWQTRPANLMGFDFSNPNLSDFTYADGFAIMNLLRICLSEIDAIFMKGIPAEHLVRELRAIVVKKSPSAAGNSSTLARKISRLMLDDYGLSLTREACEGFLQSSK
jgi:hypothetical protein